MRTGFETLDVSRCEISILSIGGSVVGKHAFCDLDDLKAWFGFWEIIPAVGAGSVCVLYERRHSALRRFAEHASEDGTLRLNVSIAGCSLSPEVIFELASASKTEREAKRSKIKRRGGYRFRTGSVPGTGKLGSYCYFRREVGTFGTHREAAEVCDDEDFRHCTPGVRSSRNAANLPSGRDDIARGVEHCWKRSRRHQWRVAR